jgi:membrane-associated phospholipid phosphatase
MEDSSPSSAGARRVRATDVVILATLAILSLLAIAFHGRVQGWQSLVLRNLAVAAGYVTLVTLADRWASRNGRFVLRLVGLLLLYAYVNLAADKLQLLFHDRWLDDAVLRAERSLFGVQPNLWMEQFVSPLLTEWMMFSYVVYLPLFPLVCVAVYRRRGEAATEEYFLALALANAVCDLGFVIFPVAGPLPYLASQFTVPLEGYVWTTAGEALRQHAQFVGGTIPSPHCANAAVMWLMAYRHVRPIAWVLAPVVVSLFVATVYSRYHYVTDAILGIAVGAVAFVFALEDQRPAE